MMRLSTHKWFYIKLVIFLIAILGPFNQTMAHAHRFIGIWHAHIGPNFSGETSKDVANHAKTKKIKNWIIWI